MHSLMARKTYRDRSIAVSGSARIDRDNGITTWTPHHGIKSFELLQSTELVVGDTTIPNTDGKHVQSRVLLAIARPADHCRQLLIFWYIGGPVNVHIQTGTISDLDLNIVIDPNV
jgi:hypothetical protein